MLSVNNNNNQAHGYSINRLLSQEDQNQECSSTDLFNTPPKNRARRARTYFDDRAILILEESFLKEQYPDIYRRETLARDVGTTEARVQVWFQNKRSRCRKRLAKQQPQQGRLDNSDTESRSSSSRLSLPLISKDENTDPEFNSIVPRRRRSKQQRPIIQTTMPTQHKSTENSLTSTLSLLNLPSLYPQLNQYAPFTQSSIIASQLQLLTNQMFLQQFY
ncbi:unnamed protein product [Didymodactylos carnosus]|uniref:Homeobox domain-containing protein n=1 Tax=Didymodactylos carnosus TaxID=1234261 RepID=A0A813QYG1_9BILA|nr:unnamed protein product [Didymodactylos carnosus]CAF0927369.1 unnamed protein product [Didymodactylos carnosus]CAF3555126.1 unnamed protein product [Didymodactylos carnosus]CAF3704270.1 unnamed protein product [Didymodactylos carnosus]